MPLQETPLSVRQGEDTSWSSRPDNQYPFQYTSSDTEKGEETSEGRAQRPLLYCAPGKEAERRFRSVINLRGLNSYTKKQTFMMATLKDASQSIRKGDWAATIDLKDAYLHVHIARVTKGSSGSGGKAEVFSSVGSHSVLLGPSRPSRRSACQLWLCAGRRGFD